MVLKLFAGELARKFASLHIAFHFEGQWLIFPFPKRLFGFLFPLIIITKNMESIFTIFT